MDEVTGVVRWLHAETRRGPGGKGCACCKNTPGLPEGHHIHGFSLVLPEDTPDAKIYDDDRPSIGDWLYKRYANKREVPEGSRIRVRIEILPPE